MLFALLTRIGRFKKVSIFTWLDSKQQIVCVFVRAGLSQILVLFRHVKRGNANKLVHPGQYETTLNADSMSQLYSEAVECNGSHGRKKSNTLIFALRKLNNVLASQIRKLSLQ
jgi:hypothetical protein